MDYAHHYLSIRWLSLLLLILSSFAVHATTLQIRIDESFSEVTIGRGIEYLATTDQDRTSDVLPDQQADWQVYDRATLSFGAMDATYWLRFQLNNPTDELRNLLLEVQYPLLDLVQMHQLVSDGSQLTLEVGDILPLAQRIEGYQPMLLPIKLSAQQKNMIYLKVSNDGLFNVPLQLWLEHRYIDHSNQKSLSSGLLFGFLLATLFSSVLMLLITRNRKFLLFSIMLATQTLALLTLFGLGNRYLWPQFIWLQQHILLLLMSASLIGGALFSAALLKVRKHNVRLLRVVRALVAVGVLIWAASLFMPVYLAIEILLIYAVVLSLLMLLLSGWSWRHKVAGALLLTLSWLITTVAFAYVTLWAGLKLEMTVTTLDAFVCNALLSTSLLFIALTKLYIDKKISQVARQQQAIAEIKNHEAMQEKMLKMEEESREALEIKIQERTFELEVTLRELEETNRELEEKNTQDALTGIRNRRFFDKKYLAECRRSRREQTELSVIMLDIDHFKAVNDTYGHLAGDDVIRFVGRTIKDLLKRPSDEGCRYGGEEFALILPNTNAEGAIQVGQALCDQLGCAEIDSVNGALHITVSCGVYSSISDNAMPANQYIEMADKALYTAKQNGRNRVIHYRDIDPTLHS